VKRRFVILVLDGTGIGAMPDAAAYGDVGADTLGHVARAAGGLNLPTLEKLGLGRIAPITGVAPIDRPAGAFGKMAEASQGKDTSTGHWEMMGARLDVPLTLFPGGFPPEIVEPWLAAIGRSRALGNRAASGTQILEELGPEHQRSGDPILYTSADSVFQVAAHEEVIPLEQLYAWCRAARRLLDSHNVARVIARPFVGQPGSYRRTYNRKDFSIETPPLLAIDRLASAGVKTVAVGKISDIFNGRSIAEAVHTEGNADGLRRTAQLFAEMTDGFLFVNLVDTDMLYGHRNDPLGFARALQEFDAALGPMLAQLGPGDLLAVTADHGCDPTTPSTDHSREYVPLLVAGGRAPGKDLGIRTSFADLGQTLMQFFSVGPALTHGRSFLGDVA
jgi:phosphopentomutase